MTAAPSPGIASLPMYDRPETRAANDRLWSLVRAHLGHGPEALDRTRDLWDQWLSPGLVLSQTCGLPFRARLADRVTLVGTPDYALPGCPPGHYRSALVVRANDPAEDLAEALDGTIAVNGPLSQSGWGALWFEAVTQGLRLPPARLTGGHRASAEAVASGQARLAAIDAETWRLIERHDRPLAGRLRVLGWTRPRPGLPFITAPGTDAEALRRAIGAAIDALGAEDRAAIDITGMVRIPAEAYFELPLPPEPRTA